MSQDEHDPFPLLTYIDDLVEDLRRHVPKAMKQWDAEAIHQARVCTRRLKAALELLAPVIAGEHLKPFAKVLKKLRRRLGPMRDLDVMIEHVGEMKSKQHAKAASWLGARLVKQREAVREKSGAAGTPGRVLSRLGAWWGLREDVEDAAEAADTLLAESLHLQLDSFAEQADLLGKTSSGEVHAERQDPHAVRIAGKNFRYTLEMAAIQGHKLPPGIMKSFKKMQEALGIWHDYVVLTERAMQVSLEELLPHHDAALQANVLDLARLLLKRSSLHLNQFSTLWAEGGAAVATAVRETFPLSRSLSEPKTDHDPVGSDAAAAPEEAPPDGPSNA